MRETVPRPVLYVVSLATVLVLALSAAAGPATAAPPSPWQVKVDPWVLRTGGQDQTEFLVFLEDQADVRGAANLQTKTERGEFVYKALSQHAERTQAPLRRWLEQLGVSYRPFWVANMIWVRGPAELVQALAERADVAHIYANPTVKLDVPAAGASAAAQTVEPQGVEWNISRVKAPDVWALGYTGEGVVIGGQDTGYFWSHNALRDKYRGWNGSAADHNYNWHDAIHGATSSSCGANSPVPCDDYGHGTHTMGTMVGDDGAGNQVGMAPGARWIGCRNMDRGNGTPATYSECYQWFIAPTDLNDQNPNPSLAPDVINNSWGCPPSEGCTDPDVLLTVVENVTAAGIVTVHSAGNSGSACSTVADPAAIHAASFTVGATDNTDSIASYSSRGPVTVDGSGRMKPDISAPGSGVRSADYSDPGAYVSMSGTSMAGPHVAGLIALMISAKPNLRGNVDAIRYVIEQSALHFTTTQHCGSDNSTSVPNNVFGWGRIDALAAYETAAQCTAPEAIRDLAIARLDAMQIQLTWSVKAGATGYNVWWNGSPYFSPGVACRGATCERVVSTSFEQNVLADATGNLSYLVEPRAPCGAVPSTPSNEVGEFEFELLAGTP